MSKVVVSQFMTLDGVVEDPGGSEKFRAGRLGVQVRPRRRRRQVQARRGDASDALLPGLFGEGGPATVLRLVDTKPVGPDGVVILTYAPRAEA